MTELAQLKNEVEIVGKAKQISNVVEKVSKKGKPYLKYTLAVMVENKDKGLIDEILVTFFSMEGSKPHNSQKKFLENGKTIENDGYDEADEVSILANLDFNEYVSGKSGKYIAFNNLSGVFIHRLDETKKHKVLGNIETIITSIEDNLNEEGLANGEKLVKGFTVGYQEKIIPIKDAIVPSVLAENFANIYKENQTATLTYQLIRRAIDKDEPEEEETPQAAFGVVADLNTNKQTFTNYENKTLIVGGQPPLKDGTEFTQEEINKANEIRTEEETRVKNTIPQKASDYPEPPKQEDKPSATSFGTTDIPDF